MVPFALRTMPHPPEGDTMAAFQFGEYTVTGAENPGWRGDHITPGGIIDIPDGSERRGDWVVKPAESRWWSVGPVRAWGLTGGVTRRAVDPRPTSEPRVMDKTRTVPPPMTPGEPYRVGTGFKGWWVPLAVATVIAVALVPAIVLWVVRG